MVRNSRESPTAGPQSGGVLQPGEMHRALAAPRAGSLVPVIPDLGDPASTPAPQ